MTITLKSGSSHWKTSSFRQW